MIVSCPSCKARYKVNEDKIKGRGAKITCPRCRHVFVVYKDHEPAQESTPAPHPTSAPAADDISRRDFQEVNITWRVRKSSGVTYEIYQLEVLRDYIDEGEIEYRDALTYDGGRNWLTLDTIADLTALFEDVWSRASRGEIDTTPLTLGEDEDEEDEDDAPTTIVNRETSLADAIRKAVKAATPAAPPPRAEAPPELPRAPVPSPPSSPAPEAPPQPSPEEPTEGGSPVLLWVIAAILAVVGLGGLALVGLGYVDIGLNNPTPEPTIEAPAPEDVITPQQPSAEEEPGEAPAEGPAPTPATEPSEAPATAPTPATEPSEAPASAPVTPEPVDATDEEPEPTPATPAEPTETSG